jgi:hypothetical protein
MIVCVLAPGVDPDELGLGWQGARSSTCSGRLS